ncbi:hypothetical protein Tco_1540354 [Tanacetum coccineum]
MGEEARLSRAAWAQSMDACDQTHSEGILLRTTVIAQQSEIVELQAADRRRQTVISELLKADYRRQRQFWKATKEVRSLRLRLIELRHRGTAKDPAERATKGGSSSFRLGMIVENGTRGRPTKKPRGMIDEGVLACVQHVLDPKMAMIAYLGNRLKFALVLYGTALTWWNSHARTVTNDVAYAMTWSDLKKKMTTKYCRDNGIMKLALLSDRMFPEEADKIERYVGGMPDLIYSSVVASKPKTMQEAIEMATDLMDRRINTLAERQTENKRKFEDAPQNNQTKGRTQARLMGGGDKEVEINRDSIKSFSCTKAQKICNKDVHSFWHILPSRRLETSRRRKQLQDVPIVKNFPEVFLEDLPGLPHTRQVEFHIDLVPGAAPVARAPYRLAPSEMKELADQYKSFPTMAFIKA